ncbi:tyrosine-type recombinase/integrase [Comamonas odontotermitis]|uniref:tyrosine-type recombinase/integrase n=1 Tax=Comamonas odontotermitis TaxID=379895 RepID=UPI001CC421A6|nr:tyrosine-type recombinase/integrase [Comamonas odontotermitis]UBB18599.1 integrase family protein [Comamonas odontotermitis]
MARPKNSAAPDTSKAIELTAGAIERLTCRTDIKAQAFLRDTKAPGLRVRVTNTGAKSFVYEAKLNRQTIRRTIGDVRSWTIEQARAAARRLAVVLDNGQDPGELDRQAQVAREAQSVQEKAKALTVGELWPEYLETGRPKRKDAWKPRYLDDLKKMATPGGEKKKRGQGLTRPGPLFPLMALPLASVDEDVLKSWYDQETLAGKHQAARALMMFRGFLRWCSSKPEYRALTHREAGRAPAILENLPPTTHRIDKLLPEQIAGWWASVEQLPNLVHSVYLRALLLSGARREEVAALRWDRIDWRWKKITIADKFEQTRTIPLGSYMAHLLHGLPRRGSYVFHSEGSFGYVRDPRASMAKVLAECGVDYLTFHGLRRTFTQVARRIVPAGVPAQISGHKPSATAEGYSILALDELRPYMGQIEREFLRLAGINFSESTIEPVKLMAV